MRVLLEERTQGRYVLSLDGDLDMATAPVFAEAVSRLMAATTVGQLLVDLADVRFLDSSGVRALLQARRTAEARGVAFRVSRPGEAVAQVLRVAAVDQLLGVGETPAKPPPGAANPPPDSPGSHTLER
ncbi:MAG TPA: STAS domain-containing protein [Natronosporangium sp.]